MITISLRKIAEEKGLNMSQVQIGAGVSMGSVRRYWYGDVKAVDLEVLDALCEFLQVTPGDILSRTTGKPLHP